MASTRRAAGKFEGGASEQQGVFLGVSGGMVGMLVVAKATATDHIDHKITMGLSLEKSSPFLSLSLDCDRCDRETECGDHNL